MKKAKIYIGQMSERVTIQVGTETLNAINEVETTWADVACVSARVQDTNTGSGEAFYADHQVAITRKEFTIRYRPDINAKNRLMYRQEVYDILNIKEPVIRAYQTIVAEKRI
jgi:head-tail adaptor